MAVATIFGGVANDSLSGGAGRDSILGLTGDDILDGGHGNDTVEGGTGNDMAAGGGDNDRVLGETGDDILYGDALGDRVGVERPPVNPVPRVITTTNVGDGVTLTLRVIDFINDASVTISGSFFGPEAQSGQALYLSLNSGGAISYRDIDYDFGPAGGTFETIITGLSPTAADTVTVTFADSLLVIFGIPLPSGLRAITSQVIEAITTIAFGNDTLAGGTGDDMLYGAGGDDALDGGTGDDMLYGGFGNDRMFGDIGADRLEGAQGDDRMRGGEGNDVLLGGDGSDLLEGGEGDDEIVGGAGVDVLRGGVGADLFVFQTLADSGDVIRDFEDGIDRIDLSSLFLLPNDADAFADGYVAAVELFNVTVIVVDLDGAAGPGVVLPIAGLRGVPAALISAADFVFG